MPTRLLKCDKVLFFPLASAPRVARSTARNCLPTLEYRETRPSNLIQKELHDAASSSSVGDSDFCDDIFSLGSFYAADVRCPFGLFSRQSTACDRHTWGCCDSLGSRRGAVRAASVYGGIANAISFCICCCRGGTGDEDRCGGA